ncbi:MAG: PfkB family carbohydrate kinase [Patescibacteria group bacterium]
MLDKKRFLVGTSLNPALHFGAELEKEFENLTGKKIDVPAIVPMEGNLGDYMVELPKGDLLAFEAGAKAKLRMEGSSLNVAAALNLFGHQVKLIGAIGEDQYAAALVRYCREMGIDFDPLNRGSETPFTLAARCKAGTTLFCYKPDFRVEDPAFLAKYIRFDQPDVLCFTSVRPSELELVRRTFELAPEGTIKAFTPAIRVLNNPDHRAELLAIARLANVIAFNSRELRHLIRSEDDGGDPIDHLREVVAIIRADGRHQSKLMVIETVGHKGAAAVFAAHGAKDQFFQQEACSVRVVDRTGAGDTFLAAYLGGLAWGWSIEKSLKLAAHAAAENIRGVGGHALVDIINQGYTSVNSWLRHNRLL